MRPIRQALIDWFRRGHREMPWRATGDPYAIWVSEIMLQQTQVETVRPYYQRWMARFPTVEALARAPLDEVLTHWSGLGYYARARNLHLAAREVQAGYGGRFPSQPAEIRALPGIGPYTAGAIASIAFGLPEPILDGNVARVLARLFRVAGAADDAQARKQLWSLAAALVAPDSTAQPATPATSAATPRARPRSATARDATAPHRSDAGDLNQAMMELGATVCTPRAPACDRCPVAQRCEARRAGDAESFPAPKRRAAARVVEAVTIIIERRGRVLLLQRPPAGLWGGLWEPPTGERVAGEQDQRAAARVAHDATGLRLAGLKPIGRFEHLLTHRRMRFSAFRAAAAGRMRLGGYQAARWVDSVDTSALPIAAWTAKMLGDLNE